MTPHLFGPEINKNENEKRGKKKDIAVILLSS